MQKWSDLWEDTQLHIWTENSHSNNKLNYIIYATDLTAITENQHKSGLNTIFLSHMHNNYI